jgi:hypothetical protein
MVLRPLPPGETVGGQGRAYWVEKYFQWLFPLIYEKEEREVDEKEEREVDENDQQYGLVWFAKGNYIRGFEGLKKPVNERYKLPFNTYFMVPMLKFIAHEGDNDGSNYGQLLNVVRSLSDWLPISSLSIKWSEDEKLSGWYSCTREDDGSFKVDTNYSPPYSPLDYYAETYEFYLSTKGYEQPSTRAVAAGYYVIFKVDQKLGKVHKIRVDADFNYHWAQRHERMQVTDTYTLEVVDRHAARYTDDRYRERVERIKFP